MPVSHRFAGPLVLFAVLAILAWPEPAHAAEGLDGAKLSWLWALPFVGILLSIATGPVFYPHVWEHHFGKFTAVWSALVIVPLLLTTDLHTVTTTLAHTALLEYMPFILLLLALFTVAGGIYLEGNLHDSVFTNTALLAIGTAIASLVGTTGAAMILIRPLIRANDDRRYNVHVFVFFIFLVCNIGGSPSGVSEPPMLQTRKMKNTKTWALYLRSSLARISGRIRIIAAPVVPTRLAIAVPIASRAVLVKTLSCRLPSR